MRRLQAVQVGEQPAQALAGGRAGRRVLSRMRPLACRAAVTQPVLCRARIAAPRERQPARHAAHQRAGRRPASVRLLLQRSRPVHGAPTRPTSLCRRHIVWVPAAAWLARYASRQRAMRKHLSTCLRVARQGCQVRARAVLSSRRAVHGCGPRLRGRRGRAACAAIRAGDRGMIQPGRELAGLRGRVHQLAGGCVGARGLAARARAQGPAQRQKMPLMARSSRSNCVSKGSCDRCAPSRACVTRLHVRRDTQAAARRAWTVVVRRTGSCRLTRAYTHYTAARFEDGAEPTCSPCCCQSMLRTSAPLYRLSALHYSKPASASPVRCGACL